MNPAYEPNTLEQKFGYFIEECGEVLAIIETDAGLGDALSAIGKTLRWGLFSSNPELPTAEQELNVDWCLRELRKLRPRLERTREYTSKRDLQKLFGELTDLLRAVDYLEPALATESARGRAALEGK